MLTAPQMTATPPVRRVPGEPGLWILILGEMTIFALYFGCITYYRLRYPDTFLESKAALNVPVGTFNTVVLLTGSLLVVLGVHAAKRGDQQRTANWFRFASCAGIGFVVIECSEYATKISHGIVPTTNIFFTLYFVLTMFHLCHVVAATVFLAFIGFGPSTIRSPHRINFIEGAGCYWHFVDALWMFLFALFYLA